MLTPKQKERIIKKYKLHNADTGSSEVQVALLTEEIKRLIRHLKTHPKDNHSRQGLLMMVAERRKHLSYLENESKRRYNKLIKTLGLKK